MTDDELRVWLTSGATARIPAGPRPILDSELHGWRRVWDRHPGWMRKRALHAAYRRHARMAA